MRGDQAGQRVCGPAARLLRNKALVKSVGYTARLHVAAWKAYGVSLEQSVLDELSRLTRDKWRPYGVSLEQSVLDELSRLTRDKWRPATLYRAKGPGCRFFHFQVFFRKCFRKEPTHHALDGCAWLRGYAWPARVRPRSSEDEEELLPAALNRRAAGSGSLNSLLVLY